MQLSASSGAGKKICSRRFERKIQQCLSINNRCLSAVLKKGFIYVWQWQIPCLAALHSRTRGEVPALQWDCSRRLLVLFPISRKAQNASITPHQVNPFQGLKNGCPHVRKHVRTTS